MTRAAAGRDRTAERLRRLRARRIRRERIASVSLGVALAVAAFFLELGLMENVARYPYFVLSFMAVLFATIVGGPLGGIVAAATSWVLDTFVLSVRIPAEAIRPLLDGINCGLAFVIGVVLLDARKRPMRRPVDELTPPPPRRRSSDERRARLLASTIDELAGSRSTAQIADTLARRLVEATGAGWVAVFVRAGSDEPLSRRATAGFSPPALPDQLPAPGGGLRLGGPAGTVPAGPAGTVTIPILVGQEAVGAALLGTAGAAPSAKPAADDSPRGRASGPPPRVEADDAEAEPGLRLDSETGAAAMALARLAGTAIERERLIARGRAATDAASDATGRVSSLSRLASQLGGMLTVEAVGSLLVEHAVTELRAEFGLAYVADRAQRTLVLVHVRGYPVGLAEREATVPADGDGPVARAARTGTPVEVASPEAWRREFPNQSDLPAMTGMRSLVAWPVGEAERGGGVLVVGWAVSGAIDGRAREVLAAAADQGGQALERAGLHAQEREAQRLQEAFISVISHELRTPITTILAGSRLLRRQLGDARVSEDLTGELAEDIEAEADRLFRIVEDLLVLSRLERRNLLIAQEPVHVVHLVDRVLASEAKRWPSHTFVPPDRSSRRLVGVVRGEETYIEQVLRNLLANAAKYSPSDSTVEVVVEQGADDVAVRVLDDGPGIARAEVEQLFSLFYRSPATAATAAGAGIGLFVSRQLVDAMGGRMWARRRRKGGSEFGFALAAYPVDEEEPPELRPRRASSGGPARERAADVTIRQALSRARPRTRRGGS
ncbi:MAG: ATP-binding protein [Chloroflexota bacterium]